MNTKYAEVKENEIIGNRGKAVSCKGYCQSSRGKSEKSEEYWKVPNYVVTWASGASWLLLRHPEEYDKKYEKWEMQNTSYDARGNEAGGDPPDRKTVFCCKKPAFP